MEQATPLALQDGITLEAWHVTEAQPALVFLHEGLGLLSVWRDWPARVCRRGWAAQQGQRPGGGLPLRGFAHTPWREAPEATFDATMRAIRRAATLPK